MCVFAISGPLRQGDDDDQPTGCDSITLSLYLPVSLFPSSPFTSFCPYRIRCLPFWHACFLRSSQCFVSPGLPRRDCFSLISVLVNLLSSSDSSSHFPPHNPLLCPHSSYHVALPRYDLHIITPSAVRSAAASCRCSILMPLSFPASPTGLAHISFFLLFAFVPCSSRK